MSDFAFAARAGHRSGFGPLNILHRLRVARTRAALARLDADALCDIGLTAAEAQTESQRGFWDAPSHWKA